MNPRRETAGESFQLENTMGTLWQERNVSETASSRHSWSEGCILKYSKWEAVWLNVWQAGRGGTWWWSRLWRGDARQIARLCYPANLPDTRNCCLPSICMHTNTCEHYHMQVYSHSLGTCTRVYTKTLCKTQWISEGSQHYKLAWRMSCIISSSRWYLVARMRSLDTWIGKESFV